MTRAKHPLIYQQPVILVLYLVNWLPFLISLLVVHCYDMFVVLQSLPATTRWEATTLQSEFCGNLDFFFTSVGRPHYNYDHCFLLFIAYILISNIQTDKIYLSLVLTGFGKELLSTDMDTLTVTKCDRTLWCEHYLHNQSIWNVLVADWLSACTSIVL
jgi:hypothetical protein